MNGSYPGNMSSTCPVPLIFEGTDGIARDVKRVYDRIMTKAYEHSLARGAVHGHEIDDWLWAEALFIVKPRFECGRTDNAVTVDFELPERPLPDVRVHMSSHQMLITSGTDNEGRQLFRILRFNEVVDTDEVHTEFVGDKLRIMFSLKNA
jgi:DUF2934 family protein